MFERRKIVQKIRKRFEGQFKKRRKQGTSILSNKFFERFCFEDCHMNWLSGKTKKRLFEHGIGKITEVLSAR